VDVVKISSSSSGGGRFVNSNRRFKLIFKKKSEEDWAVCVGTNQTLLHESKTGTIR
jgi:hypothetical protein